MRSDNQTLMMDWRVTPMREACLPSSDIIQLGKSTWTRRGTRLGCLIPIEKFADVLSFVKATVEFLSGYRSLLLLDLLECGNAKVPVGFLNVDSADRTPAR
jgi:hypothetical protein